MGRGVVLSTAVLKRTRAGRFRHVVFTTGFGHRRALDLSVKDPAPRPERCEQALDGDEARFVSWLFERKGLDARCYRNETLRRRLPACLRALRAASPRAAQHALQDEPALLPVAFNTMVIGV